MNLDVGSCYKPTPQWVLDLALVPAGDKTETCYPDLWYTMVICLLKNDLLPGSHGRVTELVRTQENED